MANIIKRVWDWGHSTPSNKIQKRMYYDGARISNLESDQRTMPLSSDATLRYALRILRARSRELSENDDYMKRFLKMLETNIVGSDGIALKSKVLTGNNGTFDEVANNLIEKAWAEWGRKENCTVTGQLSWTGVQRQLVSSIARDGEVLIRKIKGFPGNPFRFSLQLIEADNLDEYHNDNNIGGNREIRMGVELDEWKKPIAYHIYVDHPYDMPYTGANYGKKIRVPADDVIHAFLQDRPSQTRGLPWAHTAIARLNHLKRYEEAKVITARINASRIAYIHSPTGQEYTGDDQDTDHNAIVDIAPGMSEQLPRNVDVTEFKATPDTEYAAFVKTILRGIASGMGVSYLSLSNDYESTSGMSSRVSLLEERESWKSLQGFFIEMVCDAIFKDWLDLALLSGALKLPAQNYDKYYAGATWLPHRWSWIDPRNEIQAHQIAIQSGMESKTEVLASQGKDYEDFLNDIQRERKLEKEKGIEFVTIPTGNPKQMLSPEGEVGQEVQTTQNKGVKNAVQ